MLTFKLHHIFRTAHTRSAGSGISVTDCRDAARPWAARGVRGHPRDRARTRTEASRRRLLAYYRSIDPELRKRARPWPTAKQPLPIDPKLKELRDTLAEVSQPVPLDRGWRSCGRTSR